MILRVGIYLSIILLPSCAPTRESQTDASQEALFDPQAEEDAIREVISQILLAYNKHDSHAMAAIMDEKFLTFDDTQEGRADIEQWWSELFKRWGSMKVNPLEDHGIVFVTPDVAVWRGEGEFADMVDEDGDPLPPLPYSGANIFVKRNGKWLRTAAFVLTESKN